MRQSVIAKTLLLILLCTAFPVSRAQNKATQLPQAELPWQLSHELVMHGATKKYNKKRVELEQAHLLDTNLALLTRVTKIFDILRRQAVQDFPDSAHWQWEMHTSDEIDESAYCMAGGKLFISTKQIQDMSLNDAELAMLLSHEMAHALLMHHYLEDQEALRLFPQWKEARFEAFEAAVDEDENIIKALADFNKAQEYEADLTGLRLAIKAGFHASSLLRFYEKLRKLSAYPNFDSKSHPAPARRLIQLKNWLEVSHSNVSK